MLVRSAEDEEILLELDMKQEKFQFCVAVKVLLFFHEFKISLSIWAHWCDISLNPRCCKFQVTELEKIHIDKNDSYDDQDIGSEKLQACCKVACMVVLQSWVKREVLLDTYSFRLREYGPLDAF